MAQTWSCTRLAAGGMAGPTLKASSMVGPTGWDLWSPSGGRAQVSAPGFAQSGLDWLAGRWPHIVRHHRPTQLARIADALERLCDIKVHASRAVQP